MIIYYSQEDDLYIATLTHMDINASGKTINEAAKNLIEVAGGVIELLEEDKELKDYLIKKGCVLNRKWD